MKRLGVQVAMAATVPLNPSRQQILANLGNRYVVFGPSPGLPEPLHFNPDSDSDILPRVADEGEVAEARVIQTLRVFGMKRAIPEAETSTADIKLIDDEGRSVLIDLKVRRQDPKQRDFRESAQRVNEAASKGQRLQIWYLNIDQLKLSSVYVDDRSQLRIDQLVPLDVWEKSAEGVSTRAGVIDEVEDWVQRISGLYQNIRTWLSYQPSFRFEEDRTVIMSEEVMQEFAVSDRDLPILDVLTGEQVILSLVPRGLWLIGSWGRIDVITSDRTRILVAVRDKDGNFEWRLASENDRRRAVPFDRDALLALLPSS